MNDIELECKWCNKKFIKKEIDYKNQINRGQIDFYCSLSCSAKSQMKLQFGKRKEKYLLNPKKCIECGKELDYKKRNYKYCSCSCRTIYFHKNGIVNNFKTGRYAPKKCKICGTLTKSIYCSEECELENDKLLRIEKLKSGNYSSTPYSGRTTLKRALVDIRGYKCESCGLDKWKDVDIPLTVHHIDGNACHNILENLKLLCWNCHSITDNFSRRNKKSTRSYRYKKNILPV